MFPLLAQNNDPADGAIFLTVLIVVLLLVLLIGVFFLLALSRALARCHPLNRTMEPGAVWLNLVPVLGLVWQFITVNGIADSLNNEFRERGWHRGDDYGKSLGTIACALGLAGYIPCCGVIFGLTAFVCLIVYWVKIAGYSSQLASRAYDSDDRDDYDRYDDDYDPR
jgi:hypothetical protein